MSRIRNTELKFVLILVLALVAGSVAYPKIVSKVPKVGDYLSCSGSWGSDTKTKMQCPKFNLGLDLQGGIHLEYKADTAGIDGDQVGEALQAAQDVIERRINAFGVGEPLVQSSRSGSEYRIIVELPGVKDIEEAKNRIKETPFLEFKEEKAEDDPETQKILGPLNEQSKGKAAEILARALKGDNFEELAKEFSQDPGSKTNGGDLDFFKKGVMVPEFDQIIFEKNLPDNTVYNQLVETQFGWHIIKVIGKRGEGDDREVHAAHILFRKYTADLFPELKYKPTGLSGKNLDNAQVAFANQGLSDPQVSLKFDSEGAKLFGEITARNIGKPLAIFLDGSIISAPTVNDEITSGEAVITGNFSIDEAKDLVRRLNEGALPLPLSLVSQQSVEASLGAESLQKSLFAGAVGFAAVAVFMLIFYRLLGVIAVMALLIYTAIMVSIFKLSGALSPWPMTLTLSGIAGFILSIGMAVDANILIFERTKEEVRRGRSIKNALEEGFRRAWTSIRDGNVSSIITAFILIVMSTGFVKGFAVTLILGVLISMFTAVVVSRNILRYFLGEWIEKHPWLVGVKKINHEDRKND